MRPRSRLRYYLAAGLVALIAGVALTFTAEFRPLGEQMARRYGERGAATVAMRQKEAADASRAADEEKARQAAQRALAQIAGSYDQNAAEFRKILHVRRPPVMQMVDNLNASIAAVAARARDPDFYRGGYIRPEDVSSDLACSDPASTLDLLNRDERRDKNILACGVYLATHAAEIGEPVPQVTMALLQRLNDPAEDDHYPFQTIITYIWLQYLTQTVNQAQAPAAFPPLNDGDHYNIALFRNQIPSGFAFRLIQTATDGEKLDLANKIYPDLRRLAEVGKDVAIACQALHRLPCLAPQNEQRTELDTTKPTRAE